MAFSANRTACLSRLLSADSRAERAARQADTDARAEPRGALRTACAGQDLIAGNADLGPSDIQNTRATDDTTSDGAQSACTPGPNGQGAAREDLVACNRGASSGRLALG
jgi:hypothetical protein